MSTGENKPSNILTPSQTVGPFFAIGLDYSITDTLCGPHNRSPQIEIQGRLFDGNGNPIPDAVLELWQADPQGNFAGFDDDSPAASRPVDIDPTFKGFARTAMDPQGNFRFRTLRPGPVPSPDGTQQAPHIQAPHIVVLIFMRGLLKHLITRIYFAGEPLNASDPTLQAVPAHRRDTLLARPNPEAPNTYTWDIRMQGDAETVFFSY